MLIRKTVCTGHKMIYLSIQVIMMQTHENHVKTKAKIIFIFVFKDKFCLVVGFQGHWPHFKSLCSLFFREIEQMKTRIFGTNFHEM